MCLKCNSCCCCSLCAGSLWFAIVFMILFLILSVGSFARYLTVGKALQQFAASKQPKVATQETCMIVFTFLFLIGAIICLFLLIALCTGEDSVIQLSLWILLIYMILMLLTVIGVGALFYTDNGEKIFTALVIFVTMLFCWMLAGWLTVRSYYLMWLTLRMCITCGSCCCCSLRTGTLITAIITFILLLICCGGCFAMFLLSGTGFGYLEEDDYDYDDRYDDYDYDENDVQFRKKKSPDTTAELAGLIFFLILFLGLCVLVFAMAVVCADSESLVVVALYLLLIYTLIYFVTCCIVGGLFVAEGRAAVTVVIMMLGILGVVLLMTLWYTLRSFYMLDMW